MMGFLDLGRAFYYQVSLTNAVREAARYAAMSQYLGLSPACPGGTAPVPPCPVPSNASIQTRVAQELHGLFSPTSVTVTPDEAGRVSNWSDCTGGTDSSDCTYRVTVQATYNFTFITPIIGSLIGNPLVIGSSAEMRTEY
jgi:Flp pilus assembly protein TadG